MNSRRVACMMFSAWLVQVGLLSGCIGTDVSPLVGPDSGASANAGQAVLSSGNQCSAPENAEVLANQVILLINEIRINHGLTPLTVNEKLVQVSEDYGCEHIEENFYDLLGGADGEGLSHYHPITGEGPGERALRAGYLFHSLGENLAGGQRNAEEVVEDWMASTGHRENILAPQWRETGVGVRTGGHFGVYWVQMFGNPP